MLQFIDVIRHLASSSRPDDFVPVEFDIEVLY